MKSGELEFFLHLARRFARCFGVPFVIGTSRAGELCGGDLHVDELVVKVAQMASMKEIAKQFDSANLFVLPVLWDPAGQGSHEWILVAFRARGSSLCMAENLEAYVWDRLGVLDRAERVRERALAIFKCFRASAFGCGPVTMKVPAVGSPSGSSYMVLGLIFGEIARFLEMQAPDCEARDFLSNMKASLRHGFTLLRKDAEKRNERDVLVFLQDKELCRDVLRGLLERPDVAEVHLASVARAGSHGIALGVTSGDGVEERLVLHSLRVLSWNVSDVVNRLSVEVPENADWKPADNMSAVLAEVKRMKPDVVVLQECIGSAAFRELEKEYDMVGVVASHCGHVHLYVVRGLETCVLEMPDGVPVVGARVVSVDRFEVDVFGAHFPPGEDAAKTREVILKRVLKARKRASPSLVLAGDFNVREDEAMLWCRQLKIRDAWYQGNSWFPRLSKYLPPSKDGVPWPRRQRFDRVFVDGVLGAHAYLAGTRRFFTNTGCEFQLSDHFAVMAIVGFANCRNKVEKETVNDRVHRMRDVEATREERLAREMYAMDRERARTSRQRAHVQDRQAADALVRKARKEVTQRREEMFRIAFGKTSLFHLFLEESFGSLVAIPPAAWSVYSEAFGRAALVAGPGDGCGIGGLRRGVGGQSYVLVLLQCLLRMPLMQRFLRGHCAVCDARGGHGNCASCALWASRLAFSGQGVPQLLVRRCLASFDFADDVEHDVAAFLVDLLRSMAANELGEDRAVEWVPGDASLDRRLQHATFVEHVFGWVLEKRRRCEVCGRCAAPTFEAQNVLCLDVQEELEEEGAEEQEKKKGSLSAVTATELYMRFCGPRILDGHSAIECANCHRRTKHMEQRRVCRHPKVLAVQFRRMAPVSGFSRSRRLVDLEFELIWPGLPSFELHSVVYHKLLGGTCGRYSAAVRCIQSRFWRFDDDTICREVVGDVSRLCPRQIVMAFYEAAAVVPGGARAVSRDAGVPGPEQDLSVSAVGPSAPLDSGQVAGSALDVIRGDAGMHEVSAGVADLGTRGEVLFARSGETGELPMRRAKSIGTPGPAVVRGPGVRILRSLFEGMAVSDAAADTTFVARGLSGVGAAPVTAEIDSVGAGLGGPRRRGRGAGRGRGRRGAGRAEGAGGRGGRRGAASAAGASSSAVESGASGLRSLDSVKGAGDDAGDGAGPGSSADASLGAGVSDGVGGGLGARGDGGATTGGAAAGHRGRRDSLSVRPLSLNDLPARVRATALPLRISVGADDGGVSGVLVDGSCCVRVRTCGDGACALHAGFGYLRPRGVECDRARELASSAIKELLGAVPSGRLGSTLSERSGRWHVVAAAFWGMALDACRRRVRADRESKSLWSCFTAEVRGRIADVVQRHSEAVESQRLTMRRFHEVARRLCADWGVENEFVCRVARAVHGFDVSGVPGDVRRCCDSGYHGWLGPAYEEIGGQLIVKGTAARPEPFPIHDGPANKFVALADARPVFDALRKSFFITGNRCMQARIIEILCDLEVDEGDELVTEFRDSLLNDMDNINPNPEAFPGFHSVALVAFATAILSPDYWLSFDELLFLADVVEEVVLVLEIRDGEAHYIGGSRMRSGQHIAMVGIQGGGSGPVRSHFERMVMVVDDAAVVNANAGSTAAKGSDGLGEITADSVASPAASARAPTGTFNAALEKEALERLRAWEVSLFASAGNMYVIPQSQKDEQLQKLRAELLASPLAYASGAVAGAGFRLGSGASGDVSASAGAGATSRVAGDVVTSSAAGDDGMAQAGSGEVVESQWAGLLSRLWWQHVAGWGVHRPG